MTNLLIGILSLYAVMHIAVIGMSVLLTNVVSSSPDYGHGESGVFPKELKEFLGTTAEDVGGTTDGGFNFFRWILGTPLCKISQLVDLFIALSVLNYPVLTDERIIPAEGFGAWFRDGLNMMAGGMVLMVVGLALTMLFQSNILNQALSVGGVATTTLVAIFAKLASGSGLVGC